MLKAGFARVDMTPPFGTPLAGYYEMRYADGVLDPVYLNALALGDDENKIVVITADVLIIRMDVCDMLRESATPISRIGEMCGFGNEGNLKKVFRRHFGCTMREYRRNPPLP